MAPLWGVSISLLSVVIPTRFLGNYELTAGFLVFSASVGVLASYSHLLLDSLTEGGVYLGGGRIAIAHFRNGGFLLNSCFILLGLLMLASAFLVQTAALAL
jgi:hypothetical protein